MDSKYVSRGVVSLVIRKMQIKTTKETTTHPPEKLKFKETWSQTIPNVWKYVEQGAALHGQWGCKLVLPLESRLTLSTNAETMHLS